MTEAAVSFDDSAAYESFMGRWSRAIGAVFIDWLAPPANARWLDVGCGTGIFTQLIFEVCSPKEVLAVDPAAAQIDHARHQPIAKRTTFRVADAQALPFPDSTFDVVATALALNFIPDRTRGVSEMRRVGRAGGLVAGYVWDFAAELSPSWPLRSGMRKMGADVPQVPGTNDSNLGGLHLLFERAGLEEITTKSIEVGVPFPDFDDFWRTQTLNHGPITKMIAALVPRDQARLKEAVRVALPLRPDGRIEYSARANAIKARVPCEL